MSQELVRTNSGLAPAGQITTVGFDNTEVKPYAETSATALAAREQAMIQARLTVAMHRPRNIERFRLKLLDECKRPGFAEKAEYSRPVGREKNPRTGEWEEKYATGPSIRMIEAAVQFYGNLDIKATVVYETDEVRIIECYAWDLETNAIWSKQIPIPKRIEKRGQRDYKTKQLGPPRGRQVIGQRINSEGEITYLVLATDDEVRIVQSAIESKTQRKNAERLLPPDIIAEGLALCRTTLAENDKKDPAASMRRIIDGFHDIGVEPADLEVWCGKPLDKLNPKEIQQLRALWTGLKDGEVTWQDALAVKQGPGSQEEADDKKAEKIALFSKKEQPNKGLATTGAAVAESGESAGSGPGRPDEPSPAAPGKAEDPAPARGKYVTTAQVEQIKAAIQASDMPRADIYAGLQQICGTDRVEFIPVEHFEVVMDALKPQPKEAPDLTEEEMQAATARADAKKGGRLKL